MSSKTKRIVESSGSESDSGSEERNEPPPKKGKTEAAKRKPAPKAKSSGPSEDEEPTFQLANLRYVKVREFRGRVYVDIREYYTDASGDMKPGKKGISLPVDQWNTLKEHVDSIDEALKNF